MPSLGSLRTAIRRWSPPPAARLAVGISGKGGATQEVPSARVQGAQRLLMTLALSGIVATAALAYAGGVLRPVDGALAQMRFLLLARPTSQSLTVVEIDVASLRAARTWPWSRARFATAIDNLTTAGAEVVALDVDFSARSSPAADRALENAVGRRPGMVVLPTFVQSVGRDGDRRLEGTRPLASLSADALIASVNVPVDADGVVRRYQRAFADGGTERQSMAATLAASPPGRAGTFLIDYGIRAADIDRISFEAAYSGRFDPALVRGRKVLIGATALELGDEFVTPQGTLPGVYVHAVAYESLQAGRALAPLQPAVLVILAGLAAYVLRPRARMDLSRMLRRHAIIFVGALLVPLAAQAAAPVSLDTSPILLTQALCLLWATRAELKRRARAIIEAREAHLLQVAAHMRKSRNRIRAANRKLQVANEALDKALQAKREFLAATSHEIRTPLNAILGMSQVILSDRSLPAALREKVNMVQSAGDTMQALVSDILDVAQMETGALVIAPADMDLQGMLKAMGQVWAAAAQAKGLAFSAEHQDAPTWITEDATRLRQILAALMSNAIKFTDQGRVGLSARAETGQDGENLVLEVWDTGVGVPAHQLDLIFEPFQQGDGSITRKYDGAGLGLAICRQLAIAMGGEVSVRSEPGEGSRFTVRLPLRRSTRRVEDLDGASPAPAHSLQTSSVLLVDANPLFQRVLKAALADHVSSVAIAPSLEAALEAMDTQRFDLVLIEGQTLILGSSDPSAALGELVAGAAGARLSILWGGPQEEELRLLAAGADHLARKPISPADLVSQLELLCSRPDAGHGRGQENGPGDPPALEFRKPMKTKL